MGRREVWVDGWGGGGASVTVRAALARHCAIGDARGGYAHASTRAPTTPRAQALALEDAARDATPAAAGAGGEPSSAPFDIATERTATDDDASAASDGGSRPAPPVRSAFDAGDDDIVV